MFIENLTNEVLTYRAHGRVLKLKSGLNTVEDALINVEEIQRHFGAFINIYTTNATMLAQPQEVKDEEPIIEDNNLDTADTANTDGESGEEQIDDEGIDDITGEEQDMACGADGCAFNQGAREDKTEVPEDKPVEESSQEGDEEKQDDSKEEPEEVKPELESLKRGELLEIAKELNLEFKGNISNVNLIELIKEAQK